MGLQKEITQPDNQTGDYWKLVTVHVPSWDAALGWVGSGSLGFDVYKSHADRLAGAAIWRSVNIVVPAEFFLGFTMPESGLVAASIYASKAGIPGLEDAEDVLDD